MDKLICKLVVFLFIVAPVALTQAQIQKGSLTQGKLVSAEIGPADKHNYDLILEEGQFVFLKLMQRGVDMKISTFDTNGDKIEDFDSPNGKYGPELFTLTSGEKGKYRIEVSPFDEEEPEGEYDIIVETIKPKATTLEGKTDEVFAAWNNDYSPGAAVAVVKDGEIIYKKGYGLSNLEYNIPITPGSIFHIASVSKQFTVFAILLLEKQGKLSLEDDIRKYVPEVPDFGKTITLRHLATHTSGLRDQWNLLAMAGWRLDDVITLEQVLKLVSKQKDLNFNPGDEYLYCNTGFTLLAEVVARVSEMSFAEFTGQEIFAPLQMKNTLFYDDHEKIVKNRTYSYKTDSTGYKKSVLSYANVGATSLFTTVEDLSLWAMNFSNPKVGDETIIKKMNTPAELNSGKTFGGALGQFVGKYKGLNQIQHGGADAGYRSYLARFPDQDFAVSVFSNSADFNSGRIAHKVVDIFLEEALVEEPEEEVTETEAQAESISVAADILDSYVGDFELQPGFIIGVILKEGELIAQATGQPEVALAPISETEFDVVGVEAKLEFIPNGGDKVKAIKLYQNGQIMEAPRLKAFDKNAVVLKEFEGSYHSEELSTTYHFKVVDEKLMVQHSRHSDFAVNPLKEDTFGGNAWFFGQVAFQRDENNKIVGCKVSSGRVRDLVFSKVE
ncbi:serine hydrolase domain-containing protein [Muriicola sp. Z0-33]|uniref:serine hydrolase domain-containing protein n=1 Tax=Muriicola sp. Z0-33 TaxID=2816957 RepID=UPI00223759A0|nr:serine hydrolase domain-containing protein [Muriicola sp. Z0-33]MCW5516642.1 serine hydrolase [Muriicola sp. Z0-33]